MRRPAAIVLVYLCVYNRFGIALEDFRLPTESRDQLLTCENTEQTANNSLLFSVAMTVRQIPATIGSNQPGPMHWFSWWEAPGFGDVKHSRLSVHMELLNSVHSGRGFLVFTRRAQPESLCGPQGKANFGANLISKHDNARLGARLYDSLLLGQAMGWGSAAGYGVGMGGFVNDYGPRDDKGVVAEFPVIAGTVSSLDLDNLPFKDVGELAGRGVLVCSKVSSAGAGEYVCEKPFYACCQLHYNRKPASLRRNTSLHADED